MSETSFTIEKRVRYGTVTPARRSSPETQDHDTFRRVRKEDDKEIFNRDLNDANSFSCMSERTTIQIRLKQISKLLEASAHRKY